MGLTLNLFTWPYLWVLLYIASNIFTILLTVYVVKQKNSHKAQNQKPGKERLQNEQLIAQLEIEQIVNFFCTSLVSMNTKEEVIWDVAKNLIYKLGFANCMIYLWNDEKTKLLQKAGYGPNGSLEIVIKEQFSVELWQGIVGHAAATKKPVLVGDTTKDPRYRADILSRSSELAVPALYNGELVGVIDSEDFAKDHYTARHVQLLTTIAALMAGKLVAIEIQEDIRRKKDEINQMNEQLARLELASLRSQMNPHFLFNSLNSIHKYIWENKQEDASAYLTKFAKLIRMILENSKEKAIILSAEIEMLDLYIELEHRRCNGKFSYRLTIGEEIDTGNTVIPSMIIQPYVENAIWHGLVPKEGNGELIISIGGNKNALECCIEDNGIGREKAWQIKQAKQDNHKSLGLGITNKRLELLAIEKGKPATVTIVDKTNSEGPCGTKVILRLPVTALF